MNKKLKIHLKIKHKMENQIYRINLENAVDLEIFVIGTNELNPYKSTREMAVQIIVGEKQLDGSLDLNELDSLIKYLNDCKEYIIKYNEASVTEIEESYPSA
jgi:hypothetical protein